MKSIFCSILGVAGRSVYKVGQRGSKNRETMIYFIPFHIHILKQCLVFHNVGCCYINRVLHWRHTHYSGCLCVQLSQNSVHMAFAPYLSLPLTRPSRSVTHGRESSKSFHHFRTLEFTGMGLYSADMNSVSYSITSIWMTLDKVIYALSFICNKMFVMR